MVKIIKEFFSKYFLIILGGLLFLIYFWNRFIRSRTSKPIPLELTVLRFFILLNICIMFFYILISLLYRKKQNAIVEQIINWLFIPIMEFDKYVKNLPYIKPYYDKIFTYIISKLEFLIIQTYIFYTVFWLIPRLILLTALFIDVFVFHRLHYKYMVILFGLLLFFNRYLKYSLKNKKEELLQYYSQYIDGGQTDYYPGVHPCEFEPDYDPDEEDGYAMYLSFDLLIEHYVNFKVYRDIVVDIHSFHGTMKAFEEFWEKYIKQKKPPVWINQPVPKDYTNIFGDKVPDNFNKASDLVFEKMREFEKDGFEKITRIALILEYYNYTSNEDKRIEKIKIIIYLIYLICWSYVLYISLPSLDVLDLIMTINRTWMQISNPFL